MLKGCYGVTNGAKVALPQLGWKKMDETFWVNKDLSFFKLWATQCTLLRHFYSYLRMAMQSTNY